MKKKSQIFNVVSDFWTSLYGFFSLVSVKLVYVSKCKILPCIYSDAVLYSRTLGNMYEVIKSKTRDLIQSNVDSFGHPNIEHIMKIQMTFVLKA